MDRDRVHFDFDPAQPTSDGNGITSMTLDDVNIMDEEFTNDNHQTNADLMEKHALEKKHSEKLREALNKCQDAVRDLELKLVAERSLRDQESKKASLQIEKNTMDFRTQVYAIKCEAETWKQKAESTSRETQLLKEQLKVVEMEKWEVSQQLAEVTEEAVAYTNFRKYFDNYTKRIREAIQDITRNLQHCQSTQKRMAEVLEGYKREIEVYNVHIKAFQNRQLESVMQQRVAELEKSLEQSAEIKDLLMDKLTVLGVRQSELYGKNLKLLEQNQEMKRKMAEIGHYQMVGRNITKEKWSKALNELDSARADLSTVQEKTQKVLLKNE